MQDLLLAVDEDRGRRQLLEQAQVHFAPRRGLLAGGLREQAGRSDETLSTRSRTPIELYGELSARYPFTLPADLLRVAVNAEFGDWTQPLNAGDAVVFIPPVAGG